LIRWAEMLAERSALAVLSAAFNRVYVPGSRQ
jgi:hypothetical protein